MTFPAKRLYRDIGTIAITLGTLAVATPARACIDGSNPGALIHNAVPANLPRNAIVAKVIIPKPDFDQLFTIGLPVTIIDLAQGPRSIEKIRLYLPIMRSCDKPFSNGVRGFVVGKLIRLKKGTATIIPAFAHKRNSYVLPRGYKMDDLSMNAAMSENNIIDEDGLDPQDR